MPDSHTYQNLRRRWRDLMNSPRKHELNAAHHLLYLALLGKDWRKGFTCVTNPRKLENGALYGWGLPRALAGLHMPSCEAELLAPFEGVVTPARLQQIRRLVPARNFYHFKPEQFVGTFPFDAYSVPTTINAEKS